MDWTALSLSLRLAFWTMLILFPVGILLGRRLAWSRFSGKSLVEALLALPLVLPPTVLGYYLLVAMGGQSTLGALYTRLMGRPLAFTFEGLLVASVIFNLPFAIQPMQRAFEGIPEEVREAAACCGLSRWRTLWRIEVPLAWTGMLCGFVIPFAHTLGEFGVVLMVGGKISGESKTMAVVIYNQVQGLNNSAAGMITLVLLLN